MAYFSNSSDGDKLEMQCEDCPLGYGWKPDNALGLDLELSEFPGPACPIKLVQLVYNYDQCNNDKLREAMNMLIDENGVCQARERFVALRGK